jgi:hypothetical protein
MTAVVVVLDLVGRRQVGGIKDAVLETVRA